MRAVRRVKSDQHEGRGHGFADRHSVVVHCGRKLRSRQVLARLGEDQVRIGVRLHVKVGDQSGR